MCAAYSLRRAREFRRRAAGITEGGDTTNDPEGHGSERVRGYTGKAGPGVGSRDRKFRETTVHPAKLYIS